jgi:hypothetical protein
MDSTTVQDNLAFRMLKKQPLVSFTEPSVADYESEKHIRVVVPRVQLSLSQLPQILISRECRKQLQESSIMDRRWQCFFSRRIRAAMAGTSTRIASLFPGHTVPSSPASSTPLTRYRGSLIFHQFLDLLGFDGGRPLASQFVSRAEPSAASLSPVRKEEFWPWRTLRRSALSFVQLVEEQDECEPNEIIGLLQRQTLAMLRFERVPLNELLHQIHYAWAGFGGPNFSQLALKIGDEILSQARLGGTDSLLPLLFEIEGFASYCAFSESINPYASGLYGNNWIEVGTVSLSQCRASELCEQNRLLDEIVSLTERGFAPIIVNELGCVVDGNHRLTAAWIWNLLKYCADSNWDLDDDQFQTLVSRFFKSSKKISPVTRHQMLTHLAAYLSNAVFKRRLEKHIRPLVQHYAPIQGLPALLLPEYLSCPVIKETYDEGRGRVRVPPGVFQLMSQAPHSVLAPRAVYHFTDCALLPWFSILKPDIRLAPELS